MSRWRFLRRLNPVRITARIFGILLCLELPPPKVLPTILRISPLLDQQLAGFVAKLGAYVPMWIVAFVLFARAGDGEEPDDATLRWVDVQREFERAERRRAVPLDEGSAA